MSICMPFKSLCRCMVDSVFSRGEHGLHADACSFSYYQAAFCILADAASFLAMCTTYSLCRAVRMWLHRYDLLKVFQTGRSHMVVLTRPPANSPPPAPGTPQHPRPATPPEQNGGIVAVDMEEGDDEHKLPQVRCAVSAMCFCHCTHVCRDCWVHGPGGMHAVRWANMSGAQGCLAGATCRQNSGNSRP